ncbi:MAG: lactate racemase domain-containing protein, partial [candidate division Zixibacteria bacterium]|nr:lactate racemase domain-containing protein [candidate division Zixibacteria bacterium]
HPLKDKINRESFLHILKVAEEEQFPLATADLFVINDAYRPTPTAGILRWLIEDNKINDLAKVLIATGCHQPPTEEQLKVILGDLYPQLHERVLIHNARDMVGMVKLGKEHTIENVWINKYFYEAQRPVVIGSVEPHYFAGFTGGRKSIFPGLCDYDTTARNHRLAVSFQARPLRLEGNPVEEDLQSLMLMLGDKPVFSIQVVGAYNKGIQTAFMGDINTSFHQAAASARSVFVVKCEEKCDLLLAEVCPPLDSNLYQLQKALENCQTAVADGGTILLFSPCHEGIGPESFYKLADRWNPDLPLSDEFSNTLGIHKISRVKAIANRINVLLYSGLSPGIPDKVFFRSIREPQKIIDDLQNSSVACLPLACRTSRDEQGRTEKKENLRIALVRDAGHTVLVSPDD